MEDRLNQARGHKAAINNPNVSKEAKQHSKDVLRDEFGNKMDKDPDNVARGLKGAIHNPRVSGEAKHEAEERLEHME